MNALFASIPEVTYIILSFIQVEIYTVYYRRPANIKTAELHGLARRDFGKHPARHFLALSLVDPIPP